MIKKNLCLKIASLLVISTVLFVGSAIFSPTTNAACCGNDCGGACGGNPEWCGCSDSHPSTECCYWDTDGNCTAYYEICDAYCSCCTGETAAQWCPSGGNGGEPTPTPRPCGDCIPAGCGITAMFIDESKKFAENSCKLNEVSLTENQENPSSLSVAEPEQNNVVGDEIFAGIIDKSNKTGPLASIRVLIDQVTEKTFSILKIFTNFFSKLNIS